MRRLLLLLAMMPVPLAAEPAPVAAVGVLRAEGGGACTATLIAADAILTAAHCLDMGGEGKGGFTFRPGQGAGAAPAEAVAVLGSAAHPAYLPTRGLSGRGAPFDFAVMLLEHPVAAEVARPVERGAAAVAGEKLVLASYRGGQGIRARERGCPVVAVQRQVALIGCEVAMGESGSPLLRVTEAGLEVAAVISQRGEAGRQTIAIGPVFQSSVAELLAILRSTAADLKAGGTLPK